MPKLFFDTYALVEILSGNPSYLKYEACTPVINDFVYAEFCYVIVKKHGKEKIAEYADKYAATAEHPSKAAIKEAMVFRHENKKRKLSIVDSVSYKQACALGIKFLTGDMQFENMENVEFVK